MGVLVCVVCGETHQQHRLVVTPVTSSLRGTHPPVSSTALMIWRGEGSVDWFVRMVLLKVMLLIKGLIKGLLLLYVVDVTPDHIEIFMIVVKLKYLSQPVTASYTNLIS